MPYVGTSTSTASFDKQVQTLIQKTLYDELRGGLPHLPPGSVVPASFHGAGSGGDGSFRFTRVKDLDATPASHLLTEGVPPAGQELDFGYEEFKAVQRGDFVRLTDLTVFESPLQLATVAAERIKTQMATIIDNRARQLWAAGTNAIYSGTGNSHTIDVATGDVLMSVDIKKAVAMLAGAGVPRINGCYVGIIHPYVVFDLELDDDAGGWVDAAKYGAVSQLFNGEIGKYAGVRFVSDKGANVRTGNGTGSIDVYDTVIIGAKSISFGDLATTEVIVERGGVSDPLHQIQTVGWKCQLDGCLVGEGDNATDAPEPRYVRIESASSI